MKEANWYLRYCAATEAVRELRRVRDYLAIVGARNATDSVRRALKSVDGAHRHAYGRYTRTRAT